MKASRQLDNTVVVLASDNGYFYGEHGLSVERRLAYEESIRMPLLIRYPKVVKPGTVRCEFALNIDLAPTLLELARVTVPPSMQGHSLVPLLKGTRSQWRRSEFESAAQELAEKLLIIKALFVLVRVGLWIVLFCKSSDTGTIHEPTRTRS